MKSNEMIASEYIFGRKKKNFKSLWEMFTYLFTNYNFGFFHTHRDINFGCCHTEMTLFDTDGIWSARRIGHGRTLYTKVMTIQKITHEAQTSSIYTYLSYHNIYYICTDIYVYNVYYYLNIWTKQNVNVIVADLFSGMTIYHIYHQLCHEYSACDASYDYICMCMTHRYTQYRCKWYWPFRYIKKYIYSSNYWATIFIYVYIYDRRCFVVCFIQYKFTISQS